jgi:hypothetical protein
MAPSLAEIGRAVEYWLEDGSRWTAIVQDQSFTDEPRAYDYDASGKLTKLTLLADIMEVKTNSEPMSGPVAWIRLDSETMSLTWIDVHGHWVGCSFKWLYPELSDPTFSVRVSSVTGELMAELQVLPYLRVVDLMRQLHTMDAACRYFTLVLDGIALDPRSNLPEAGVASDVELTAVAADHGVGRKVRYWSTVSWGCWSAKVADYDAASSMTHLFTDIQVSPQNRSTASSHEAPKVVPRSGSTEWCRLDLDSMTWADGFGHGEGCHFEWLD